MHCNYNQTTIEIKIQGWGWQNQAHCNRKTWHWQCFNFPAFQTKEIPNILRFFFPVLTKMPQTMIIFIVPLCLGEGQKLFDSSIQRAHWMKTWRGVLHSPATAGKHRQEASSYRCWSVAGTSGLHSIPRKQHHGISWDPCAGKKTCCTLKKAFHPNPLPDLPQTSPQNLHAERVGQCHFGLPTGTHAIASAEPRQACWASKSCWGPASFHVVRLMQSQQKIAQHCQSLQ